MISLLVLGEPYYGARIAQLVNAHGTDVRALHIPPRAYARALARPPRADRTVLMRVGFRTGATTPRGRIFDAYWSALSRRLAGAGRCHYWLGTDVLNTLDEARSGSLRRATLLAAHDDLHLAVAPWLTTELESVGLQPVTALLPPPQPAPVDVRPLPETFRALTYLPEARFGFYGGDTILEAARRLPRVEFEVIGSSSAAGRSPLTNVRWRGWVADMAEQYARTTVVVRVPGHDGFGNTVIEGLQHARHVIYTHALPSVRPLWPVTPDGLVAVLEELLDAHEAGRLAVNEQGRAFALEEFEERRLVDRLVVLIRGRA